MNKKTINGLIVVGGVIVAFLIAKKYLMGGKGAGSNGSTSGGTGGSTGGNTGGSTGGSTGGGTYDDLDFMAMANNLFEYMDGYGTNYNAIFDVLRKMRNQSDWNKLQQVYGTRKLSSGKGNIFVSDFTGNLKNSLIDELNDSELVTARGILSSKGIAF